MNVGPFSSIAAGLIAAVGIGQVVDYVRQQPIVIHGLRYDGGYIVQDRTVRSIGEYFYAGKRAQINVADTNMPIPGCVGQTSFNYPTGYQVDRIPLAIWVGSDDCTPESLPPGRYVPVATWFWGSDQEDFTGEPFVIGETR